MAVPSFFLADEATKTPSLTPYLHGSMVLLYMVTWIPSISSIYPLFVRIYTSTMDPMGYLHGRKRDFLGFHGTHAASGLSLAR